MKNGMLNATEIKKLIDYFNRRDRLYLGMGRELHTQEQANRATFCLHVVPETILEPKKAVILGPKDVSISYFESNNQCLQLIMSDSDSATTLTRFLAHFPAHKYTASVKQLNVEGLINGMDIVSVSTPENSLG